MQMSWNKLFGTLTLSSAVALGACALDDANTGDIPDIGSDSTAETTHTTDPVTGESQYTININGISINLSVRQWQMDMNAWIDHFETCGPPLDVDGGFGPRTTAATICMQRANGLQANGDVGRITLGAMCADLTTAGQFTLRDNTNCMQ